MKNIKDEIVEIEVNDTSIIFKTNFTVQEIALDKYKDDDLSYIFYISKVKIDDNKYIKSNEIILICEIENSSDFIIQAKDKEIFTVHHQKLFLNNIESYKNKVRKLL